MPTGKSKSDELIEEGGITPETIKRVDDIYAKEPADITGEEIAELVTYLRQVARNVEAAESAGKRITKKAANTTTPSTKTVNDFLSTVVKDV